MQGGADVWVGCVAHDTHAEAEAEAVGVACSGLASRGPGEPRVAGAAARRRPPPRMPPVLCRAVMNDVASAAEM